MGGFNAEMLCDAGRDLGDCELYLMVTVEGTEPPPCVFDVSNAPLAPSEDWYPSLRVWTGAAGAGDPVPEKGGPTDCGDTPGFHLSDGYRTLSLCPASCKGYEVLVACVA